MNKTSRIFQQFWMRTAHLILFRIVMVAAFAFGVIIVNFGLAESGGQTTLSLQDRVAYQRGIEEVDWKHTIWPPENPQPKPGLEAEITQKDIQLKVEQYLRKSIALNAYWHKIISAEQMQVEIDRIARETRDPEILQELFAVLHNDPYLIAECIARPLLVDRITQKVDHFDEWWAANGASIELPGEAPAGDYRLPEIKTKGVSAFDSFYPQQAVAPNTWNGTTTAGAPSARTGHTAVWTGTKMIVWGGVNSSTVRKTGGVYTPSTNSWTSTTTTGAPTARAHHTAVWTGTQMIVWGGYDAFAPMYFNTGGRYTPSSNSWSATTTNGTPAARELHAAVWTGTQMIVWGGWGGGNLYLATGGRYTPSSDSWTATTTTGAPSGRYDPTAVWTGTQMIVWGGKDGSTSTYFKSGGRYTPSSDSWTATTTTGAPTARVDHTAVWTGTQMIVWGGYNATNTGFRTGGRYTPSTNSWTATTTTSAPTARTAHTAVWTGTQMIVWGGYDTSNTYVSTGGRYNPSSNSWTATTTVSAPSGRNGQTAVWTGTQMIVWGGYTGAAYSSTGGRYTP